MLELFIVLGLSGTTMLAAWILLGVVSCPLMHVNPPKECSLDWRYLFWGAVWVLALNSAILYFYIYHVVPTMAGYKG